MGAAGLPFLLGRLVRNRKITPGVGDPAAGLASLYTDSILHDGAEFRFQPPEDDQAVEPTHEVVAQHLLVARTAALLPQQCPGL